MKRILLIVLTATAITACKPKQDATTVKNETMKIHDQVMANHGKIIANQMKIDTLLKDMKALKQQFSSIDTIQEKTNLKTMLNRLLKAEESMNDWMHHFNPDYNNTNMDSVIYYYKTEKQKINVIDSLYKREIQESNQYLSKFKKS
ncbi:hypothetical protein [Pedobacter montanisoli]|uniref:Viral A-type inclusion protein n=1 Tax=Pedobacter montanisoli TaxID=2923277 RepID=A0ABS9ZYT5_9SPHI|nr:hypothetical protein [Pedobacter montanisoli]MCJ0743449.1 hypothetical protein [Pedobacter montanisoli]